MKNIAFLLIFCALSLRGFSQVNNDSVAYQLQRKKINGMLQIRAQKFGRYAESLRTHTGIFGLQTKRDIRKSNDILMDIVKTDNEVYRELKILLEYRTFQQTQVQSHSKEIDESNIRFMTTINKLRNQVDQLKVIAANQREELEKTKGWYLLVLILMLGLILFLITRRRKRGIKLTA